MKTREVKVWDGVYYINVAPECIAPYVDKYEDEQIGFYVPEDMFNNASDDELEEYVNREGYDWKGQNPNKPEERKNFVVQLHYHTTATVIVEATSEEEAIDLAREQDCTEQLLENFVEDGNPDVQLLNPNN